MDKKPVNSKSSEERLEKILEVLVNYTRMDFQTSLPLSDAGDEIDAVASGINMLGEELAYSVQKQLETQKQLEEHAAKLEAQNKELQQFIYITSHDLQEPLRTATSISKIMNEVYATALDEEGLEMLDFMLESVDRMGLLLKGLLDYLIINNQEEKTEVDFNKLLVEIKEEQKEYIEKSDAYITTEGELPTVLTHGNLIKNLLTHLIANAIKFRKPEQRLECLLSAEDKDDHWVICVSDNGIGIEEQYFDRIFKIFQRLHSRAAYAGTGIGLAQCKKIMEALKGEIWVKSSKDIGSSFYFSIPK